MPNDFNVSVDISGVVVDLFDRFMGLFGRDQLSLDVQVALKRQLQIAGHHAASVQIIGMDRPVPILKIYQPTRLRDGRDRDVDFARLLRERASGVILGGPGRGKTVLMHYLFATLSHDKQYLPLLVTLRWPDAVSDLEVLVQNLEKKRLRAKTVQPLVLLIDGYDEISVSERRLVDKAIREFIALDVGPFYLTCRLFYDVSDVHAPHYEIAPFDRNDSLRYVAAFADAYDVTLSAESLLDELEQYGFGDFVSHPLMLAMICILKSGPVPRLPRNSIGVIRRAIDTLTLRWDESKKIRRATELPLDGEDRVRCLMLIAYNMRHLVASEARVHLACEDYLRLAQWQSVNATKLLDEIAQWYGIFVPVGGGQWSFVHRTIHDLLAARFWVESGRFSASTVKEFDTRAAYAAALSPDATRFLVRALGAEREIHAFVECMNNNAMFDSTAVAEAIVEHFVTFHELVDREQRKNGVVTLATSQDFFGLASDTFLDSLALVGVRGSTAAHELVFAYAVAELRRRDRPIPDSVAQAWTERFRLRRSIYEVSRGGEFIKVR